MTRAEMTAVFLASLDDLATHPYFSGGTPDNPQLDWDTFDLLLSEVEDVPYAAYRWFFEGMLASAPLDDVERLMAAVSGQLETAENGRAEAEEEAARARAAREAAVIVRLDEIRVEDPARHTELMEVLARLVNKSRAQRAAS